MATATKEKPVKKARAPRANGKTSLQNSEELMEKYTPDVLKKFWKNVQAGLNRNDKDTMKLVGDMFYKKQAPGVLIQQNLGTAAAEGRQKSFDAVVRKIQAKEDRMIEAPAATALAPTTGTIVDAEFTDQ